MKKFKNKTKKTSHNKKVYNLNYVNFLFSLFHFFVDLIIIKMVTWPLYFRGTFFNLEEITVFSVV